MSSTNTTLRLHFPQWQGGNNPAYHFGARLLSFLAPGTKGRIEEIAVAEPTNAVLENENGIVGRSVLKQQLKAAEAVIQKHQPKRIVILGGDCLVDLAPFAYLSELYQGELGILWVDAHPDIMTPQQFSHAHAMVLGNLLGYGDDDFRSAVKVPVSADKVMLAGLGETSAVESNFIRQHSLSFVAPEILNQNSETVLNWLKKNNIKKLAIHLDLDVIDPNDFRSLLFANPDVSPETFDGITQGKMSMAAVQRLLCDVGEHADVVGLGIAEHLPWDSLKLSNMLAKLPLLSD